MWVKWVSVPVPLACVPVHYTVVVDWNTGYCSPNLGRLEGIFGNHENLTICWCVIIVKITTTFHTDELLVSKAVRKCNVPFHIVHICECCRHVDRLMYNNSPQTLVLSRMKT